MSEVKTNLELVLFGSTVLVAMIFVWGGFGSQYGQTVSSDIGNLNQTQSATSIYTDFKAESDAVTESDLGGLIRVVNNILTTVRTVFSSINLFLNFLGSIALKLIIPGFIVSFFFGRSIIRGVSSFINIIRGQEKL